MELCPLSCCCCSCCCCFYYWCCCCCCCYCYCCMLLCCCLRQIYLSFIIHNLSYKPYIYLIYNLRNCVFCFLGFYILFCVCCCCFFVVLVKFTCLRHIHVLFFTNFFSYLTHVNIIWWKFQSQRFNDLLLVPNLLSCSSFCTTVADRWRSAIPSLNRRRWVVLMNRDASFWKKFIWWNDSMSTPAFSNQYLSLSRVYPENK